jgi:hypothetical protein
MRAISGPVLIVCEGPTDCAFVRAIAQEAGVVGAEVQCPSDSGTGDGKTYIPRYLEAALSVYGQNIRVLGLIVDNDDAPDAALALGKDTLMALGYDVTPPNILVTDNRRVGLYTLPEIGAQGTLEDLLLLAVFDANPPLRQCVEAFEACAATPVAWPPNVRAKGRLEAVIASQCRKPQCGLRNVWKEPDNPIPRTSPRFRGLRDFLLALVA